MAEGERQNLFSDRGHRNYKSSPLLNSLRKNEASETSSLSESIEAPKSYGATRNPLQTQCDVRLIGHVVEPTDTLQGLAIKYAVTIEQLRRANKIWANDNIHLFKILKIPVKKDSKHYVEDLEFSEDESGTDDSGINEDKITISFDARGDIAKKSDSLCDASLDGSEEIEGKRQQQNTASSFLEQLDARIKCSKKESEKLRTVSGPKVIADLERAHSRSLTSDDDLFRPLEAGISRRQRGQVLASKRHVRKEKTAVQDTDDQFFEL